MADEAPPPAFEQQVAAKVRSLVAARQVKTAQLGDALSRVQNPRSNRLSDQRVRARLGGEYPWSLAELEAIAPLLGTTPHELTQPVGA